MAATITVNAIALGPAATKLFLDGKPKEAIDHLTRLAPLERLGEPSDIAAAVSFLAGHDGSWINGQVLRDNELQMSLNAKHRRYRRRYHYGSMRQTAARNASVVEEMAAFSRENQVDLRALELDVQSEEAVDAAVEKVMPYFAAKAAMDAIAVQYARELSRWGIKTSIIVPGAFTSGTNHFAHAGRPANAGRVAEYEAGPCNGFGEQVQKAFAAIVPPDADAGSVVRRS